MLPERFERHDVERSFVGGCQDNRSGYPVEMGPQPIPSGDAPSVAGMQPREAVARHRSDEVIADPALVIKEFTGHHCADRVTATIIRTGRAGAIPQPSGQRINAAGLEFGAEDVAFHGASMGAGDRSGETSSRSWLRRESSRRRIGTPSRVGAPEDTVEPFSS